MMEMLGPVLIVVGILGVIYQCVIFVKETLPANYGNNPGFGALEMKVFPWVASVGIGLGLMLHSWIWGVSVLAFGLLGSGFLAMLLGRLFGGNRDKKK